MKVNLKKLGLGILLLALLFGLFIAFNITKDLPLAYLKNKYAPAPSQFYSMQGLEVHYRDEGILSDTIPIILLHGTGSSLHTFNEWVKFLKQRKRVLRLDLPGFGLTGPFLNRDYSMDHYVAFLKDFLDQKQISRYIIAGNSFGGEIGWKFTIKFPDIVHKLILINAAGLPGKSKSKPLAFRLATIPFINQLLTMMTPKSIAKKSVQNVYFNPTKLSEEVIDRYYELTLRPGNRQALIDRMNSTKDFSEIEQLSTIKSPTLILWGEADKLIPIERGHEFNQYIPNSDLVIIPNSGHVPMEETPSISIQPMIHFIDQN